MARFNPFSVGSIRVRPKAGRTRSRPDGTLESYWEARRTVDGTRRTVWQGWGTQSDAEKAVAELALLEPDDEPEIPGSLAFLLAGWLAADVTHRADLDPKTVKAYTRDAGHLIRILGHARASTLTTTQLERYRDGRLGEGAATSTVRQELKRVASAWGWARNRRLVPNRHLQLPKLRVTPKRPKYTPPAREVRGVIAQLEETGPLWAVVAVRLLLATGARVSEIGELTWANVGPDELALPAKGGGVRPFPRTRGVDRALELAGPPGAPEDTVTGTTPDMIRAHLGRFIREAGGRFSPHGVRRCVEDQLADAGVDLAEYAALLGHSPQVALAHYRRPRASSRARAASHLDEEE